MRSDESFIENVDTSNINEEVDEEMGEIINYRLYFPFYVSLIFRTSPRTKV